MRIIDVIRIAFTNLSGNKMRSALTIFGIGVGIATIVFLVSLGYGLQELSLKRIASIGAVTTVNVSAGKVAAPDEDFAKKYEKDTRVESVVRVYSTPIQGQLGGQTLDGVSGIVPTEFFDMEGIKPDSGTTYPKDASAAAVVSTGFVKGFSKVPADLIGQNLKIRSIIKNGADVKKVEEEVKVYGVFVDDTTVIAYISPDFLALTGQLNINQVKVKVRNRADLVTVKNEIENSGYSVSSVADTIGQVDQVFNILKIVLAVFGGIALIVASIGMFNTMTIALLERTRDVGVMKSTGTDDSAIYLIFLSEAVLISSLGGFSGLALGYLSTFAVNYFVNTLAHSVGGEVVQLFSTPLLFVAIMIGFSLLVGISTGFFPAMRAAKLNPLEALRYE